MKNEILYRVCRIILVLVFVLFLSMIRNNVKASYESANTVMENMPGFVVKSVSDSIDKSSGLKETHDIVIQNVSKKKQDVSFVLADVNGEYPYNYMNYTIIKNDKIVKKGIVKKNEALFNDKIGFNDNSYKIIFSISQEDINYLGGVSISAQISFV